MAANVMASKVREVNLILIWILINSVCGSVVVVSGSRFESFFFLHVRPRTYGHARAKERPVWLLFLACGFKVFFYFIFLPVRARTTYGS